MKKTIKGISLLNIILLAVIQLISASFVFISPSVPTEAVDGICSTAVDVVLVIDRSGSMGDTSRCDWWQLVCKNKPSCSLGYEWIKNTTYNQLEGWCNARTQSAPHQSIWTSYNPIKIVAAKDNANKFLDLLGTGDQSALVSFANDATLDKQLSNDHVATKTTVNNLVALGATNIGDAINLAKGELTSERKNANAQQIMILLTDGMANKPSGPGYGEYAPDVTYAITKATEAKASDIKIFTIGLGNNGNLDDINEDMLGEIASDPTYYYHAPTEDQLQEIYHEISKAICCGDGVINQDSEECDDTAGVSEHYNCSSVCKLEYVPYCGDNIKNGSEECDGLSGLGENQSCSSTCTIINSPCIDNDHDAYCATVDCDDTNPAINPGATEICDLLDNNCDGQTDETFSDLGSSCSEGIGMCLMTGTKVCSADGQSTVCSATAGDPAAEVCDGYLDENCDGTVDENCGGCIDGATQACGPTAEIGVCKFGIQTCAAGAWSACLGSIMPTDETCDGFDNDCDGESDETFLNLNNNCTKGFGKCQASGQYVCSTDFGATTCNASPGTPDETETCGNNLDDDCDGAVDEDCSAAPFCGDNTKNGAEECDGTDGVGTHQSCSAACTLINLPYCGDGLINNNEQCDGTAGLITGYHCTSSCSLEADQAGPTTGSLSGYTFEDLDGATTTTSDLIGLSGWLVNLFNSASSTLPVATTTTDADGYFEFKNLLPDSYNLTEILQTGWQQISAPSTPLIITAGLDLFNNNFINYQTGGSGGDEPVCGDGAKNGTEQCDGSDGVSSGYTCDSNCILIQQSPGGSGGGGGGTGYVCGNGIREGSEVCDGTDGVTSGYTCNAFCTASAPTVDNGQTATSTIPASPIPSNPTNLEPANVGGSEETEPSVLSPVALVSGASGIQTKDSNTADKDKIEKTESILASSAAPTILGAVSCAQCPWWLWILLAILHLAIVIIFVFAVSPEKETKNTDPKNPNAQLIRFTKGSWWWLGPVALLLVIIFCLLFFLCHLDWLILAGLLGSFYLTLIAYYALLRACHGYFYKIATVVFLTLAPLVAYLYCPWVKNWLWALVLIPYIISLAFYWLSLLKLATHKYVLWGWFVFAGSALMVILEWLIEHCQCWQ